MHGTLRVLRVNKVWYNFATVLRLRFAISVSWIYIPQTAALGTAQSCDTWTAEHRKGGGGAKCAVNTITCRVDLSVSAVWIRYQNCCCHWFTSKQMKHLVEKGNRLNLNHLQQVVPLSGLTCDVITIAKPEEPLLRRLTFSPVGLLSSFSLPSLIFFRNLVSVFQQLYQRVIRLLRTTLWSKALHVIKTNTSWLVSSTVPPPPPEPCGPGWLWSSTVKRPMTMRSCWPAVFVIQRQQPKSNMEDPRMFPFLYRFKLWVFTGWNVNEVKGSVI